MKMTNTMKRFGAVTMTGIVLTGVLAGCGSSTTTSTNDAAAAGSASIDTASNTAMSGTIDVVSREDGSGTRGAFIELFGIEEKNGDTKVDNTTADAIIANQTEVMMQNVAGDEYAIGYASLGSVNDSIKVLNIDGAEATTANVLSGDYKVSRPFNIATNGTPSDVAQDFMNYILSADGQKVVTDAGYVQIAEDAEAFTSTDVSGDLTIGGSSSVTPVMEKLKEAYAAVNSNVNITIQESDSTTGMNNTIEGICDIGMASRALSDEELKTLTPVEIALDGIAVIVNTKNTTDNMTSEQVKSIFTGATTDWSEISE